MGGSGGGGTFVHRTTEELQKIVRKSEDQTTVAAFEADSRARSAIFLAPITVATPRRSMSDLARLRKPCKATSRALSISYLAARSPNTHTLTASAILIRWSCSTIQIQ